MPRWEVRFYPECEREVDELEEAVRVELFKRLGKLEEFGPDLGRPDVDTLNGSSFPNMKELRFQLNGLWRFAFAFDPKRQAIVLVGGDKEGERSARFYSRLVKTADSRFAAHTAELKKTGG
jgi:hypothetical protein